MAMWLAFITLNGAKMVIIHPHNNHKNKLISIPPAAPSSSINKIDVTINKMIQTSLEISAFLKKNTAIFPFSILIFLEVT